MTLKDLIDQALNEKSGGVVSFGLMTEAVARIEKEFNEKAIQTCQELLQAHASILKSTVQELQVLRKTEAMVSSKVKRIDRAFRYFKDTGNPFPLFLAENPKAQSRDMSSMRFCGALGLTVPEEDSEAWKIPADWSPKD